MLFYPNPSKNGIFLWRLQSVNCQGFLRHASSLWDCSWICKCKRCCSGVKLWGILYL